MDKLRNLSVSSADFNYDPNNAGGSMPGADAIDITIRDIIAISFTWYQAHLDLACVVEVSIFPIGLITMLTHPWT